MIKPTQIVPFFIIASLTLRTHAFVPTSTHLSPHTLSKAGGSSSLSMVGTTFKAPRRKNKIQKKEQIQTELSPLKKFSNDYQQLQKDHYLTMAFMQAGFLASFADITTQSLEGADINFAHVAAMATVASTMSGSLNAIFLSQLENAFPGTETKEVISKTLIHATIIAFIINSAYLVFVPFLTQNLFEAGFVAPTALSEVFSGWSVEEFIILTKLEVMMFIPYNTIAFKFIPPSVRPLTHALVSATFNIGVSAVTLGYFDEWCDKAMHLF